MGNTTYTIQLRKASELTSSTTTSGIASDFSNNSFPLFYHTYDPNNSFVAVPPELLKQLAEEAGKIQLSNELDKKIAQVKKAKGLVIENLRKKYQMKIKK